MPRLDVLLAVVHEIPRAGLRALLCAAPQVRIFAEAHTGPKAIGACQRHAVSLAVIDQQLPELDGSATACVLRTTSPQTTLLLYGPSAADDAAIQVAGAHAGLPSDATAERLWRTVELALQRSGSGVLRHANLASAARSLRQLTAREREVLGLLAGGASNREIGAVLQISEATAKTHVERIASKLDTRNRTAAALRFAALGLEPE